VPDLHFSRATVDLIAVAAAAGGLVALVTAIAAHLRFGRQRQEYSILEGGADGSLLSVVRRQADDIAALRAELGTAGRQLDSARNDLADAIRHVAVVRYDAFADMGGRLSFSAALLDDAGDGLVLTSINGRTETRTYAKAIRGGASEHTLSPEEEQSIGLARGEAPPSRRARHARQPATPTVDLDDDVEGVSLRP
jgi:Protein of unknown function (DUF4446)